MRFILASGLLVIILLIAFSEKITGSIEENFEGTGLELQIPDGVSESEAKLLPKASNAPAETIPDTPPPVPNDLKHLDSRSERAASLSATISEEEIPPRDTFIPGTNALEQVPREKLDTIKHRFANHYTAIWNSVGAPNDPGVWEPVAVLEISTKSHVTGAELITLKIQMIETKRLYSKDFIVELIKFPEMKLYQIISANIESIENKTHIENILRGKDQLSSEFYNYSNDALNGNLSETDRITALANRKKILAAGIKEGICFGTRDMSAETRTQCELSGGKWDLPVSVSNECPYYRANKNYPNDRGGARGTGYCEMPLGLEPIGFRYSHPRSQALCHNCGKDKTIGPCCKEQERDKLTYPTLVTPDYAFPGDRLDRIRHGL